MASVLRGDNLGTKPYSYLPPDVSMAHGGFPYAAKPNDQESLGALVARVLAVEQRVFPAAHEIYAEGELKESLYIVVDGWAFLYKILEDGRRQILDFALPGSILGLSGGLHEPVQHTAESLTELKAVVVPRYRLGEFFARDSSLAMRFVEFLAGDLEGAYESLTDAGRRTAREAVAHLLLRLAQRALAGRRCDAGTVVELPLTLEHMGDAIGLTAVHVCRILRGLREDGVVTHRKGRLRIDNPSRLGAAAGVLTGSLPASSQVAA